MIGYCAGFGNSPSQCFQAKGEATIMNCNKYRKSAAAALGAMAMASSASVFADGWADPTEAARLI
jgi:hypothetical protein